MPSQRLLHAAMFAPGPGGRWGLPLLLWGPPGAGKTALVRQFFASVGLVCHRLSPGERGEGQFGVVPVPSPDLRVLHYPPPDWAASLEGGGGIFVDEINTAPPALQAPLLGLVQLATLGSHVFGPRVRVLGAANATSDAAGGWDLAPALANRFGHLDFGDPDLADWFDWLLGARQVDAVVQIDALAEERRVMDVWPGHVAKASGVVAGFLRARPDLLRKQPKKGDPQASRAWPSPRAWEHAVIALAAADAHGLPEQESDELVGAFVGHAVVMELARWRNEADLPDPEALLDGKVGFEHDPRRLDRTMAVLASCAALVVPEKAVDRKRRAAACWNLINRVVKQVADVTVPAARAMCAAKPSLLTIKEATAPLNELQPILAAAGVNPVSR